MKFNPDCVRDILLTAEENTGYHKEMVYESPGDFSLLSKYNHDEIMYHLSQCKDSGLIDGIENIWGEFKINDLTPLGHDVIAKIREDKTWKKILKGTISSIPTLITIAAEVYSALPHN
ncbi:DUF2513 domain-containing protein [Clostridium sp. KNHs205]|jgi:hypothetical protein|uniref:DUF2513 domain-containing protein n=1 Tax=Clostridium sp. KNHs205 TaxID=1449050 RepID=UPI00051BBAC8|nr:DUF2513 domain-containing protein [Clostridium sp. KNHs205]